MTSSSSSPCPELIPGLPDEVAERCLLHLPHLYHRLFRSVSSTWNRFLTDPSFLHSKSLHFPNSFPFLFAFAFHPLSRHLHCQALDPFSRRWFLLPTMPLAAAAAGSHHDLAVAAMPGRGEIYVLAGGEGPTRTLAVYRAATNSWVEAPAPVATPAGPIAAAAVVGGRVVVAGEDGITEAYDPEAGRWAPAAARRTIVGRYDAAAVGGKMYITEGWTWPFEAAPRGAVYDGEKDSWAEMAKGMKEGWTGSSAVAGGHVYIVAEYGEGRVKRYDEKRDAWHLVAGGGVPPEVRRPYAVAGEGEGDGDRRRIYVVGSGLDVAIGTVMLVSAAAAASGGEEERVEWEVVRGPTTFVGLTPCNAHVLYL